MIAECFKFDSKNTSAIDDEEYTQLCTYWQVMSVEDYDKWDQDAPLEGHEEEAMELELDALPLWHPHHPMHPSTDGTEKIQVLKSLTWERVHRS